MRANPYTSNSHWHGSGRFPWVPNGAAWRYIIPIYARFNDLCCFIKVPFIMLRMKGCVGLGLGYYCDPGVDHSFPYRCRIKYPNTTVTQIVLFSHPKPCFYGKLGTLEIIDFAFISQWIPKNNINVKIINTIFACNDILYLFSKTICLIWSIWKYWPGKTQTDDAREILLLT